MMMSFSMAFFSSPEKKSRKKKIREFNDDQETVRDVASNGGDGLCLMLP